ncbi:TatD family hydrolase [Nitriliruptor alkaliphilus]|uniref:TatD family hydrolase n=1 Tax=Nitriliruptor alkaliphilus TaxID=427918 RepID=UPI000695F6C7|nr:TatD family hydrolase [Nitriliruptor alkaliphilus]
MPYVDTHCHLDHHFDLSASAQVAKARAAGVTTMITVGTDMASSTEAVSTARRHDGVFAAVGVHPNDAMEASPQVMEVIGRLATEPDVVAIGETGLDYYRDHTTPKQQEASFRAHIDLAVEHDRTLIVHCREAWDDLLDVLDAHGAPERVVMHCFSGDEKVVARCAEHGWYLSFAGNVTFKNAGVLRDAAAATPLELLLTETDSPYLTPHPHRGEANDPSYLPFTLRTLAELHGRTDEDLADVVMANAIRAFALPTQDPSEPT